MTNAATTNLQTRKSSWFECKNGPWYPNMSHGGITHYRIWQQFDGMRWFQRHEWKRVNGSLEMEEWIPGVSGWVNSAVQS